MTTISFRRFAGVACPLFFASVIASQLLGDVILPNLPPGTKYEIAFVTLGTDNGTSSDIAHYNNFVTTEARRDPVLWGLGASWTAIASTLTVSASANAPNNGTIPVYNTAGQLVANSLSPLYGSTLYNPIDYTQFGASPPINGFGDTCVWTGTNDYGAAIPSYELGTGNTTIGLASNTSQAWINDGSAIAPYNSFPLYALSAPITSPSVWAAAVSGNWTSAGNWSGVVPNAVGAGAVINAPTTAAVTITLGAPQTLGTLLLGNSGTAGVGYTLNGTGSNALTLNNSGNGATIVVTGGTHAVNAPLVLNDNLIVISSGSLTLGGVIANGSDGPMGITLSGGLLVLGGGNTYSGNTALSSGTLTLAHPLAVQNSTLNVTNSGTLSFAGGNTSPTLGGLTGAGNIALATAAMEPVTLSVGNNGQSTTYDGILTGPGGLTKSGTGTLTFAVNQVYSGPTVITAGTLRLSGNPVLAGFGGSGTGWQVNSSGISSTPITNNVLTLTDNNYNEAQSAFYNTPTPVNASFTANFVYQASGYLAGDGVTFVLQNDSRGLAALGGNGGYFGYATGNGVTGIAPSVAINVDLDDNQTAFDSNGSLSPATSIGNVNLRTGDPIRVSINYNALTQVMAWTLTDTTAGTSFSTSQTGVNLQSLLGGSVALVGFAGGDSGFASTQTISNFSLTHSSTGSGNNILPVTTALSIAGGGTLDLSGGSQQVASLSDQTPGSGGSSIINSGTAASLLTLSPSGSTTFSGTIQGGGTLGTISLVMSGSGTQVLAGSNSYTGGTAVNAGTLQVAGTASLPGYATAGKITVASGGVLAVSAGGSGWTSANIASLLSSNGSGFASGSALGIDTTPGNLSYASNIAGTMGLAKLGANTLTLAGSETYTGSTAVKAGTLQSTSTASLPGYASTGKITVASGGVLAVSVAGSGWTTANVGTLLSSNGSGFASGSALGIDTTAGNLSYTSNIAGSMGLAKLGANTLTLAGSDTYTGPTTINQGELLVNGSLVSPVTVNSGGTLGGTGHLSSGTVSTGGCIAPGNLPQGLSFSGGLLLATGAEMDYALDTPSTSDEISCASLALNNQQFSDFHFTPTANFVPGTYDLIESGAVPIGTLGSNTSGTIDGYSATLAIQGNDLVLTVPEPSTLALLGAGVLGLFGWAWRRRRAKAILRILLGAALLASAASAQADVFNMGGTRNPTTGICTASGPDFNC